MRSSAASSRPITRARKRGGADPLAHCALNVALYGDGKRWACTERGHEGTRRDVALSTFSIGPSSLCWDGNALTIHIDELSVPLPRRIRGSVRVYPEALFDATFALDADRQHRWSPLAPCARVEVNLSHPQLRWAGAGYLDSNHGDAPLEGAFRHWHWMRAGIKTGSAVLYDGERRDGSEFSLAMRFDRRGKIEQFSPPPMQPLPSTLWRIARSARADRTFAPVVSKTLEDTPFYARSLISTRLQGEPTTAVHESLSLQRFSAGWVQMLLPFRMPRVRR